MEKINLVELLKECPKGMELDCTMFDNVTFNGLDPDGYPIKIKVKGDDRCMYLTENGCWNKSDNAKCIIFPKGKTTWEGFVPPCKFKDGDIAATEYGVFIGIVNGKNNEPYETYCAINGVGSLSINAPYGFDRLATEEEKEKLFKAIKDNGYQWNPETKTLENIEPKFKVGDRIRHKNDKTIIKTINYIYHYNDSYGLCDNHLLFFKEQDNYELVPNKFDINTLIPFESKVLVRDCNWHAWEGEIFTRCTNKSFNNCDYVTLGGCCWKQCIPYNDDTKYLLGTTNDCDEYFKNWK